MCCVCQPGRFQRLCGPFVCVVKSVSLGWVGVMWVLPIAACAQEPVRLSKWGMVMGAVGCAARGAFQGHMDMVERRISVRSNTWLGGPEMGWSWVVPGLVWAGMMCGHMSFMLDLARGATRTSWVAHGKPWAAETAREWPGPCHHQGWAGWRRRVSAGQRMDHPTWGLWGRVAAGRLATTLGGAFGSEWSMLTPSMQTGHHGLMRGLAEWFARARLGPHVTAGQQQGWMSRESRSWAFQGRICGWALTTVHGLMDWPVTIAGLRRARQATGSLLTWATLYTAFQTWVVRQVRLADNRTLEAGCTQAWMALGVQRAWRMKLNGVCVTIANGVKSKSQSATPSGDGPWPGK